MVFGMFSGLMSKTASSMLLASSAVTIGTFVRECDCDCDCDCIWEAIVCYSKAIEIERYFGNSSNAKNSGGIGRHNS